MRGGMGLGVRVISFVDCRGWVVEGWGGKGMDDCWVGGEFVV